MHHHTIVLKGLVDYVYCCLRSNLDKTLLGCLLFGDLHACFFLVHLRHATSFFLQDDFNVSWLTGVLSNTTMGTVSPSSPGRSTVTLGMIDYQGGRVKTLGFGIGHGVFQKIAVNSCGLDRPASPISWSFDLLGLSGASNSARESDKGNNGLERQDIIEVRQSLVHVHALGEGGNVTAVLEVDSKMRASGLGGLLRHIGLNTIADHLDYVTGVVKEK